MAKKYFTAESAQKQLPKIRKSLLKLQSLRKTVDAISSVKIDQRAMELEEFAETSAKLNKEYHKISYEFYLELERLEKTGCILKELDLGLVDFYFKFEGRDVFLCWKLGEGKITAWHEIDSGYGGRQTIIDLEEYQK